MSIKTEASTISFSTTLFEVNGTIILRLPKDASAQLPSRGQTMVEGTVNGITFKTPLEPDGNWSHWFTPDTELLREANAHTGSTVKVSLTAIKSWPEPYLPTDLASALDKSPAAYAVWEKATPMAHWEWVRWTRSTNKQETRARRVEVAMSKLTAGERRPCCWNRNLCTDPTVSKNGVLLVPAST